MASPPMAAMPRAGFCASGLSLASARPSAAPWSMPGMTTSTPWRSGTHSWPMRSRADTGIGRTPLALSTWRCGTPSPRLPASRLWRLPSERYNGGRFDEKVMVYPGGGYYYAGKGLEQLRREMLGYRAQGYKVVKMKIGGADLATDLARIEAVIDVVGEGGNVAVDAN